MATACSQHTDPYEPVNACQDRWLWSSIKHTKSQSGKIFLHATPKPKNQVERALLLDVVIRKRAPVLELLTGEDEALLVRRDSLLVLDLRLHVVDAVRRLDVQRDRLPSKRLHKDLHTAAKPKNQVERALLLDVVIRKRAPVLEL